MKSVHIPSYSGPYSVRMRENADQNNSEEGHFSRSGEKLGKRLKHIVQSDDKFDLFLRLMLR